VARVLIEINFGANRRISIKDVLELPLASAHKLELDIGNALHEIVREIRHELPENRNDISLPFNLPLPQSGRLRLRRVAKSNRLHRSIQ
jgi:hypothetical protein